MGGVLSSFFQSSSALLSSGNNRNVSESTRRNIQIVFNTLMTNPKITVQGLEDILSLIPKNENLLHVYNDEGYNLLQKVVGLHNLELVKWCLSRNVDVNRGACSLPLHIACLRGYEDCVEVLLKHGARTDIKARMCWPGPHNQNCEQRGGYNVQMFRCTDVAVGDRSSDKEQNAIYYAIDGDQMEILESLTNKGEDNWLPWQQKRPLLHIACERGAWNCVKFLVDERRDEINQCYDEYFPIHQAVLHDIMFVNLLIQYGAQTTVRTCTQQMTVLHVIFLLGKKSAQGTLETVKLLLQNGLREHINTADSLGYTPLHALIVRYALEEGRYGLDLDPPSWNKSDMLLIVRYLLENGAAPSINQPGNSALTCVMRHLRDWKLRYELLEILLSHGGQPNLIGRDGSVPLMVCFLPLIKDPLNCYTKTMKTYYLNCVRILCKNGANPNCSSRPNDGTPLHILLHSSSEIISLPNEEEKTTAFTFIRQLLVILLEHGLDPNVSLGQRTQHILLSLMDMVHKAMTADDLYYVNELTITLLQYGANPNINISITEPMICHSQSSVFLKKSCIQVLYYYVQLIIRKEELLIDTDQRFTRLLYLYYYSMNHNDLYQCLKLLFTQTTLVPMKEQLASVIRELYTKPRTLKQISRVVIYGAIKRKSALALDQLPLPAPLKEYILNFEP